MRRLVFLLVGALLAVAAPAMAASVAYINTPLDTPQAMVNTAISSINNTLAPAGSGTVSGAVTLDAVTSSVNLLRVIPGATGTAVTLQPGGPSVDTNTSVILQGVGTGIAKIGSTTTCSGTTTATCNAQAVKVSITGLVTAASGISAAMTVTDTSVTASTALVVCSVNNYAGTGVPVAVNVVPGTGQFTFQIQNVSTGAALNATVQTSCLVFN